jgi:hypothetical protein
MSWRSFKTDPPQHAHRALVTNNLSARDAHGQMSHIWIGHPIWSTDGMWVTFDDADRKIRALTHWMPLPTGSAER